MCVKCAKKLFSIFVVQVDSYGGYLKFKVSYSLQRGGSEPKEKPDVVLSGNKQKFIYRRGNPTLPDTINHREIQFTEVSRICEMLHVKYIFIKSIHTTVQRFGVVFDQK